MRHIIAMLITMLALAIIMPAMMAATPALVGNVTKSAPAAPDTNVSVTPSQAAFFDDNWVPSAATSPVNTAIAARGQNGTLANSTQAIYDVLNDNYVPPAFIPPTNIADWPNKNNVVQTGSYSIYDFANDNWAPGQTTVIATPDLGYAKGKMS